MTKLIALTALDQKQLGDIKGLGFDVYVSKPITKEKLNNII